MNVSKKLRSITDIQTSGKVMGINMKKSCRIAYNFALEHAGGKALERRRKIDCTYTDKGWLEDLLFVTDRSLNIRALYGKTNDCKLLTPFLNSKYYSISDLIRRQKGSLQAIQYLWQELMQVNFEGQTKYRVPIVLLGGRHDSHVSSALAKEYFDKMDSPKQFYWFEKSCHFPQWNESQRFYELMHQIQRRNGE